MAKAGVRAAPRPFFKRPSCCTVAPLAAGLVTGLLLLLGARPPDRQAVVQGTLWPPKPGVVAVLLPPITQEWDERTAAARAAAAVATFADAVLVLGKQQPLFRSLLAQGRGGLAAQAPELIDHGVSWGNQTGDTLNAAARAASQARPDARWLFIARVDQNIQFVNDSASAISAQLRADSGSLMLLCHSHGGIDAQGCFFRLPLKGSFAGPWGVTFVPHDPAASLVALASPTVALGLTISPAGVEEATPHGAYSVPLTGDIAPVRRARAACEVLEQACCEGCVPPADGSAAWALLDIVRSLRALHNRLRLVSVRAAARRFCELAYEVTDSRELAAWAMHECADMAKETNDHRAMAEYAAKGMAARPSPELAWQAAMAQALMGNTAGALEAASRGLPLSCFKGHCQMPAQLAYVQEQDWWESLSCGPLLLAFEAFGAAAEAEAERANCSAAAQARREQRRGRPLLTGLQAVALARGSGDTKAAATPNLWCPQAACSQIEAFMSWELPPVPWEISQPYSELAAHPLISGSAVGGACGAASGKHRLGGGGGNGGSGGGGGVRPCSLLVAVPGMGGALLDKLLDIFWKNKHAVEARAAGVFDRVDWQVVSYNASQHEAVASALSGGASRDAANVEVIFHQGLVGDHLRHSIRPEGYDFVFILLDDVELVQPIDWPVVMALQQIHRLDLLSGCSVNSSASFMVLWCNVVGARNHDVVTLSKVRAVELYATVFTAAAFKQYRSWLAPYNPTLHGPEAFLHYVMGLSCGVFPSWGKGARYAFAFHHHFTAWGPQQLGGSGVAARYSGVDAQANRQRYVRDMPMGSDEQNSRVLGRVQVHAVFHYAPG